MAQFHNQVQPLNINESTKKSPFLRITLKEILTLFIGTAIPVAIGIYTSVTNEQMHKSAKLAADEQQRIATERQVFDLARAAELYQQQIYKDFLDAMYILDKDGKLNDSEEPWAFANARYRAAHREFDAIRKGQALLFLKERQLIGRQKCITGCEEKNRTDIINLSGLSFDSLNLISETGNLSQLDLRCVEFDQVSMINAIFSYTNLNGVVFKNSRLNGVKFKDSSLNCSKIINTELHGTDFDHSNLNNTLFNNVDLSTATLTQEQKQIARFEIVIWSDETRITDIAMTPTVTTQKTTTTTTRQTMTANITRVVIPNIAGNATWSRNATTVAGGNGNGNATNQFVSVSGLYIEEESQMILIADTSNHRIMQWKMGATNGQVVAGGNGGGKRLDQLNGPTDVLVDKENDSLIICDCKNNRIVRWYRKAETAQGEILTDNLGCWRLAIDDQRYLYVSDGRKHEVRRYQLGGDMQDETIVASWNPPDIGTTSHLACYIFVDRQQTVYASREGFHNVMKWNKDVKKGIVIAEFQKEINNTDWDRRRDGGGLFVDTSGTLYIVDPVNRSIMRWPQGALQGTAILVGDAQWHYGTDLAYDSHGNLYVSEWQNYSIQRFSIQ